MTGKTMGERVRSARRAKGMTQAQLAKAIGVSRNAITQLEIGNTDTLTAENTQAAATILGTTVEYLLHGEEPKGKWATKEPRKMEVSPDEVEIVLAYRAAPLAMRGAWRQLAKASITI